VRKSSYYTKYLLLYNITVFYYKKIEGDSTQSRTPPSLHFLIYFGGKCHKLNFPNYFAPPSVAWEIKMRKDVHKLIPVFIVVLGFFTLGISDLVWIYIISDKLDRRIFLPIKQVALTVITFGIYGILWSYKIASKLHSDLIINNSSTPMICAILSLFFLRNLSVAILFHAFNTKTIASDKENEE